MVSKYELYCMIDDIFNSCKTTKDIISQYHSLKDVTNGAFEKYLAKIQEERHNG